MRTLAPALLLCLGCHQPASDIATPQTLWRGGPLPSMATLAPSPETTRVRGIAVANTGLGSGIALAPGGRGIWLLTDRGPNYESAPGMKTFLLPGFAPRLALFTLQGDGLALLRSVPLRGADGRPLTGFPNPPGAGGNGESAADASGNALPYDPAGVDSEGLVALRDGTFWISEEYGPALLHVGADGRVLRRLSPFSGACALPVVVARRRQNRGIEALAGMPDGAILVAALEAPLDNPQGAARGSRAVRLLVVDTRSCATRQLVYLLDGPGTVVSDMAMIGAEDLLVIESDRRLLGAATDGSTVKRVYRISLAGATDVSDAANSPAGALFGGVTLEQVPAGELAARGITPVAKALVVDLLPLGYPHDKAEGLAILDRSTIAISNDDDFGIADDGAGGFMPKVLPATRAVDRNEIWFVRLATPLW